MLNENCESHEVKGLYVLDAAWMPMAGASNPSITLIANRSESATTSRRTDRARASRRFP